MRNLVLIHERAGPFRRPRDMKGYYQMKPRKAVGLGALELSSHEKEILKRC